MNDKFEDLLDEYWEAAYSEGFDGRVNDTKDARAQRALAALCEYHEAILARVARLEEAARFVLDECDWEESANEGGGDNRIGPAIRRALEEK